ncbi:UNVERIFIED_CONTAM: hypothetical protein HDU68_009084 [Siphonaria sp. JEL0065]|nr:hypothetical protein HDU68_009084 [Siphonaria sp. JEL0065]
MSTGGLVHATASDVPERIWSDASDVTTQLLAIPAVPTVNQWLEHVPSSSRSIEIQPYNKHVEYYVQSLMNPSIRLLPLLGELKTQLQMLDSTFNDQFIGPKVLVPSMNTSFTGLECLAVVLNQLQQLQISIPIGNDFDEIRYEILDCLDVFDSAMIRSCNQLASSILGLIPTTFHDSNPFVNLVMRLKACKLGEDFCYESEEGLCQVRDCITSETMVVSSLVSSLNQPTNGGSFGDTETLLQWQFRTSLLGFIIAFVRSSDDASTRESCGTAFENAGLETVLDKLSLDAYQAGNDGEPFLELVKLYRTFLDSSIMSEALPSQVPNMQANTVDLTWEIEALKSKLEQAKTIEDDLRQQVADLKELNEKLTADSTNTEQMQTISEKDQEIRRLKDLVGTLMDEREVTKQANHESEAPPHPQAVNIKRLQTNIALDKLNTFPLPSTSLKLLEWTKVQDNVVYRSIWGDISSETYQSESTFSHHVLDEREISTLSKIFAKPMVTSRYLPPTTKAFLFSKSRSQQIEILLKSIRSPAPERKRLTHQEIRDAILSNCDNTLTPENLEALVVIMPTQSEIELVLSYQGDFELLGNAEKFVRIVSVIPCLKARLEAIFFHKSFSNETLWDMQSKLALVSDAAEALVNSPKFLKMLQIVLVIGNFVNGNTFRGGAYGFELKSLLSLKDTKAVETCEMRDRAPTLLHYLARRLEEIDPDLLELKSEIGSVELASRTSFKSLIKSINDLQFNFDKFKTHISILKHLDESSDLVVALELFATDAELKLKALAQQALPTESNVQTLFSEFGLDSSEPEDDTDAMQELMKSISLRQAIDENASKGQKYSRLSDLQWRLKYSRGLKAVEGQKSFVERGLTFHKSAKSDAQSSRRQTLRRLARAQAQGGIPTIV